MPLQSSRNGLSRHASTGTSTLAGATLKRKKASTAKAADRRPAQRVKRATRVPADKAHTQPARRRQEGVAEQPKEEKKKKRKKLKQRLVEDKFSMPESDYRLIGELKKKCFVAGVVAKKNDLLRVGVRLLDRLSVAELARTVSAVEPIIKK